MILRDFVYQVEIHKYVTYDVVLMTKESRPEKRRPKSTDRRKFPSSAADEIKAAKELLRQSSIEKN